MWNSADSDPPLLPRTLRNISRVLIPAALSILLFSCARSEDVAVIRPDENPRTALIQSGKLPRFEAIRKNDAVNAPGGSLTSAYRIFLPNDVRNGFLLPPGKSLSWKLETSRKCRFRCRIRWAGKEGTALLKVFLRSKGKEAWPVKEIPVPTTHWDLLSFTIPFSGNTPVEIELHAEETSGDIEVPVLVANPEILQDTHLPRKPSILLISIDTLRRDHLSIYGYSRPTSPALRRWAAQNAVVFDQAVSAASWTLPSHVSLLTGLDAAHHGINHDVGDNIRKTGTYSVMDLDFLAEILRDSGWMTAAWTGGAYLHERFGFSQGFERFLSWSDRAHDAREFPLHLRYALRLLKTHRKNPVFIFLHSYAVHDPYRARPRAWKELFGTEAPPGRFALNSPKNDPSRGFRQINRLLFRPPDGGQRKLRSGEIEKAVRMYDSGIRYVDDQLASFLDELHSNGLDQNLIIVLTSDHGEAFGAGERWGHIDLSDDVLRVPLLISFPKEMGAGRRIEDQVSSTDLVPTLLDYLGIEAESHCDGHSLLPLISGKKREGAQIVFSLCEAANRGISMRLDNEKKLVFDTTPWDTASPGFKLFDLKEDPFELHPQERGIPDELKTVLLRYLEEKASGLRLEIINNSGQSFSGDLLGAMIRPVGTKMLRPGKAELHLNQIGKATFSLPDGEKMLLSFEKVFGAHIKIKAESPDRSTSLDRTLNLRRCPIRIAFDGRRWKESDSGRIILRLEWHGGNRSLGEHPLQHGEEVRDQLKALGYIE